VNKEIIEENTEIEFSPHHYNIVEKKLALLKEDEFREDILIPLFKAMRFQNVINYHGGSKELGKDIIMWKEDELFIRQNYAVVVKVGQITGKIGGKGTFQTVATQVSQALNTTFLDEKTLEEQSIHKCIIVTNQFIKKEARDALFSILKENIDKHLITIFDLDNLIKNIIKYRIITITPDDIFSLLEKANHDRTFKINGLQNINGKKVISFGADKNIPPEKTDIKLTFHFPNDKAGLDMEKKVKDFLDHGGPIDVPRKYVTIDSPDFNNEIGTESIAQISIGNIINPTTYYLKMEIDTNVGNSFSIPFLEFKKKFTGRKSFTLVCDFEPLVFTISIRIEKDNKIHFNYTLKKDLYNYTMYELLLFEEFCLAISKGGKMYLYDIKTNIRVLAFTIYPDTNNSRDNFFLELFKKGTIIQQITNTLLYYPHNGFTQQDINDINNLFDIISNGYQKNIYTSVKFYLKDIEYLKKYPNNNEIQNTNLIMRVDEKFTILNNIIDLGVVSYYFDKCFLNYQKISEKNIEVKVSTNKDCPASVFYEKYFNKDNKNINK